MHIQPAFPEMMPTSTWKPPEIFPDLTRAKRIQIDCETKDPRLKEKGPGFVRGESYVVGVAVKTDGFCGYYPVRHAQGQNLAPNVVFEWLGDQLKSDSDKVGANLLYDFEALHYEGIRNIGGRWLDVQVAEALIDEETAEGYSLEVLGMKYLNRGKDEELLRHAASMYKKAFKGRKGVPLNPKTDMWVMPAEYVGAYAEADVVLPELILQHQLKIIGDEGLDYIWKLESDLIPILLKMRLHGIAVDLEAAHNLAARLKDEIDHLSMDIIKTVGMDINVDSGQDLQKAYERLGNVDERLNIQLAYTLNGNPSFTADWLLAQTDPLSKLIVKKRKLMTMRDDYVVGDIIGESVNGRVYARFNSLRKDDSGTRSGRFSSTNPNLQQVPARDEYWAPLIRGLFIPDAGKKWLKADYSQQEPRLLLHFAHLCGLPQAQEAIAQFKKNPRTDYHQMTTDLVNRHSSRVYKRKQIKGINLGIMYSMGLDKLCRQIGVTRAEGEQILAEYHKALPFVRELSSKAMSIAQARGFIMTILKRRRRFNLWEPVPERGKREAVRYRGLPREIAEGKWPGARLQRYGIHKALNALIQGSAADQTKQAMRVLYQEFGIVVQLQVHDELGKSVADVEEARTIKRVMETCIELALPVVADTAVGPSWGAANEEIELLAA